MRIVRVTAQNLWRIDQLERTPQAAPWVAEAEDFLLGGRAVGHLRRPGTTVLAADHAAFVGLAISYPDPNYQQTIRLGSLCVDHRVRRRGVGRVLFDALVVDAVRSEPYAIWLVHPDNTAMVGLSRSHRLVADEAVAADGYVQFFAERD